MTVRLSPASLANKGAWGLDAEPDTNWRHQGNCTRHDPEVMFPWPSDIPAEVRAIGVCANCPVTNRCGQWALDHQERHGVWGGMTQRERDHRAAGRLTICPACRRGHYQRYLNQLYCLACRRPPALTRAERGTG